MQRYIWPTKRVKSCLQPRTLSEILTFANLRLAVKNLSSSVQQQYESELIHVSFSKDYSSIWSQTILSQNLTLFPPRKARQASRMIQEKY